MKLKIKKESLYNYAEPVSFSPHHVRIFPRVDLFVKVERVVFETAPGADVQYRQDLFDNLIAYCFYPKTGLELPFRLELDLEVKEKNPFHFVLESTGFKIPPEYRPDRAEILEPYLRPEGGCKLPDPLAPTVPRPTVETLVNFNHWIYENIAYESRQLGKPYTPYIDASPKDRRFKDAAWNDSTIFDFIKQNDRIRLSSYLFSKLPTFFVSNISWRRANQTRDGKLLHIFRHINSNKRIFRIKYILC